MPRGPQGQKRPVDAVARAVMVAQIATGELGEEVDYAASSKPRTGSAGGNARAKKLSPRARQSIAKAAANARWNDERRADMTNQERLKAALFGNPAREHVDIKFFLMNSMELTHEQLCGEAVDMLEQMDANEGETSFAETFEQRDAAEFIATL